MVKTSEIKSNKKMKDRTLLVLCAIVLLCCGLIYLQFLYKLKIEEGWIHYISMCIAYIFMFFYGVNKLFGLKKVISKKYSILFIIIFIVSPIFIGFVIFHLNVLSFPKRGRFYIYTIILTIILSISITSFIQCVRYFERKRQIKRGD
jgi:hypothetical protein